MANLLDEVSKILNNYTEHHIKIIKILIPDMDRQFRVADNNKTNLPNYPNYQFFLKDITTRLTMDDLSIIKLLKDFERDGLLMKTNPIVWAVTDKGNIYFKKINELCPEIK
jgi:hypothetical protein